MMVGGVFARYFTDGSPDPIVLEQPDADIQGLTHVGGDQFLGIAGNELHQYDVVADRWMQLTSLSRAFPDAGLAFDFGVLYAITSDSDQLFTIDLTTYEIAEWGARGLSSGGGLSTSCKPACRWSTLESQTLL
jgi:hypothetical protein